MKYVVDRFEGCYAILENMDTKEMKDVLRCLLPSSIYEGSILDFDGEKYFINEGATNDRRKEILSKFERLKNNTDE